MTIAAVSNFCHAVSHTASQPNYLNRHVTTLKGKFPCGLGNVFIFSQKEDSTKTVLIPREKLFEVDRSDRYEKITGFVGVILGPSKKGLKENGLPDKT